MKITPLQVTGHQFQNNWSKIIRVSDFKYFTYNKYRLKDTLVKETSQSKKKIMLWRSWGKQADARIYVQGFHEKLEQTIN